MTIIAGKRETNLNEIKRALSGKFEIKDVGELSYFLGVKVEQRKNSVWTNQHTCRISLKDLECKNLTLLQLQ